MNPYEKTAEEMKRQSEGPKRFAKTGLALASAAGATAFSPLLARAASFLSPYLSQEMAIKGLSKISPKFGSFINEALGKGKTFEEVKDFIGSQIQDSKKSSEQSQNPIERISQALHQFILQEIGKGRKPQEALAVAKVQGHEKDIQNVSKKIGKNLFDIIDQLYGSAQSTSKADLQGEQPHPNSMRGRQLAREQAQQQQTNQGIDPALQKILDQGNQLLQRFKGQNG